MIWCGLKIKENCLVLVNQFNGNFRSKTISCRKIKSVFRDVKWWLKGLNTHISRLVITYYIFIICYYITEREVAVFPFLDWMTKAKPACNIDPSGTSIRYFIYMYMYAWYRWSYKTDCIYICEYYHFDQMWLYGLYTIQYMYHVYCTVHIN